MNNRVP